MDSGSLQGALGRLGLNPIITPFERGGSSVCSKRAFIKTREKTNEEGRIKEGEP